MAFGLIELGQARGFAHLAVNLDGALALARHLVLRMASARAAMLFSAEEARKMEDMRRIFRKLGEGQMTKRNIYRPLSLAAAPCQEGLEELEAFRLVRCR